MFQPDNGHKPIVYTLTANCRDCYRCVRVCPVKAIRIRDGQAYVDDTRCIQCGTCVRECPQHAKTIRTDTERVRELLGSGARVAVSIAPSFATVFPGWKSTRIPAALRRLGFGYVAETAEGARTVALATAALVKADPVHAGCVGGACPAVVHYIEKYRPELVDQIVPVVSPMIAHARMLKERLGAGWSVVFVGPCAAKKQEAARPEYADAVDAVLTFMELGEWLEDEGIDLATCIESDFESPDPLASNTELADARLFALAGGMLKTASIHNDGVRPDVLHTSGAESVMELLDVPAAGWAYQIVEPLFCAEGCINGPGIPHGKNLFERKNDLIRYAREKAQISAFPSSQDTSAAASAADISGAAAEERGETAFRLPEALKAVFIPAADIHMPDIAESRILEVFEQTGKSSPDMQLNCGACGYKSCRDNAIAVVLGMAEPEMCIPYMRRLAEQRTDRILETSPNGIMILDDELRIVNINPAFRKMFQCGNAVLGRQVSYLMDASGFETLSDGGSERFEAVISHYGRRFHEVLYTLRDARQYVGIFMDISDIPLQQKTTDIVRMQTLRQAQELLDHQIRMSQEIAGMLGKSTAKGEEMVHKLMSLYGEDES
jgi:iron only hydrogenase large subunit-like protein/uncharacterized Fe-S cluster-containing protein